MEATDHATEGDPLKSGEDGVETGTAPSATELKKKSCKDVLGFAKLTHWRTAAFFLFLFICLTVVFAFSFIIHCPVRPQYLASWNRTFPEAGVYSGVAFTAYRHFKCKAHFDSLFYCHSKLWLLNSWNCKQRQGAGCAVCPENERRHSEQFMCFCR